MDAFLRLVFLLEVERQAALGLEAADDLRAAASAGDNRRCWISIQGLLIAFANVSKLLWGTKKTELRREPIRILLSVSADSPLASRQFRNHFEHFDERMEAWALKNPRSVGYSDLTIGPIDEAEGGMRHFDPATLTLMFWGERFEVGPSIRALHEVRAAAKLALPPLRSFSQADSIGSTLALPKV